MKPKHDLSRPNHVPRVALLVDTSTDWSRRVISGIIQYVRAHDFWHLYVESRGVEEHLELPRAWQGDGIIARISSERLARSLHARGLPVVNVSAIQLPDSVEFPRVHTDVADTAKVAVNYFLERGFKNFAYLSLLGLEYTARQQDAFIAAVEKTGGQAPCMASKPTTARRHRTGICASKNLASGCARCPSPSRFLPGAAGAK